MNKVTIQLDSSWVKVVHSTKFKVVMALQGVSVTFAPLFLFWSGNDRFLDGFRWVLAIACFVIIIFVGSFNMRLGAAVLKELIQYPPQAGS